MTPMRTLVLQNVSDVADEAERLRAGCSQGGKWSLPQVCWHASRALSLIAPTLPGESHPTPQQDRARATIDPIIDAGGMPYGLPIAPGTEPPAEVGPSAIDEFIDGFRKLASDTRETVTFGPFGPMPLARVKDFIRIHAVHHLRMLRPTA